MFYGYIFSNIQNGSGVLKILAYDQLRYLTCKDTISYSYKTASQVVSMMASNFNLKIGSIESSSYTIPYRLEENQKILDIIYTALDLTTSCTGKKYVFFDDFGKITLKSFENMTLPLIVDCVSSAIDFSYQTSIDKDVYNYVKVYVNNPKVGHISTYVKESSETKNKWGTLQYFKKLDNSYTKAQAEEFAQNILEQKNRLVHSLDVVYIGDCRVRAGNLLNVTLSKDYTKTMVVEYCKHIIKNNEHIMELSFKHV